VKADPEAQRRLLDLQALDTALNQLAHKRRNLPQQAQLAQLARDIVAAQDARVGAQVSVDDLDRDIARLEKDVEQVRQRAAKDADRLANGHVPAREIEALQHEITSLARRQSELEDNELELMERRETAQASLEELTAREAAIRAQRDAVEADLNAVLGQIDKEEQFRAAGRKPLVADLPADLITLYDRIRESSGGIGAALLRAGRCGGCRLELSGADLVAVRSAAPDDVVRCEECRRILVRTTESGL
jgi:predicted  nucleic acid-binding Zn-ribbon protein